MLKLASKYGTYVEGFLVTTPPAKADGFLRSQPLQQRLLRQRMSRATTLTPEGSVQADVQSLGAFQILRHGLPVAASEFEVVKGRRSINGLEAITLLTPPNLPKSVPPTLHNALQSLSKGEKAHSSVA